MQTTNERIDEALVIVAELIGWARADMEASYEAGATDQGDLDRHRVSMLMQAERSLKNAIK